MPSEPIQEPVRTPVPPAGEVYWARPAMVAAMLAVAAQRGYRSSRPIEAATVLGNEVAEMQCGTPGCRSAPEGHR